MALNSEQKKAVVTTEGRVLVLAGAGSGKTSVIVHRIAHLVENRGVSPTAILGLTFTNKAAREMKERLIKLMGPEGRKVTLCTFHSFCMQILRKEIHRLGYTKDFTLYDEGDIKRLVGQLARNLLEQEGELPSVDPILAAISQAKNQGISPQKYTSKQPMVRDLYERLQSSLRAYNAVDFDSLLSLTVELFEQFPEILHRYQEQYRYLMIDEYQDTSPIQYRLAELLAAKHRNLCVVGDDDQSIYGWRGAEVKNIIDFPCDTLIKLQQNYRSLPPILHAANHLIAHNEERHDKALFSSSKESEPIVLFHAPSSNDEASTVVHRLLWLKKEKNLRWDDFAILYRSNHLTRPFELALMQSTWQDDSKKWRRGIPYEVIGGTEFYARSEIKDLMAYLKLIVNPRDEEALLRIINVPRRGISDKTLDELTQINRQNKLPLWEVICNLTSHPKLTDKAIKAVRDFAELIRTTKEAFEKGNLQETLTAFLEKIHYQKAIEDEVKNEEARLFKWDNVQSYVTALGAYEEEKQKAGETASLSDFLGATLLDESGIKGEKHLAKDCVHLMTFHGAKGLEFEACFLVCLEDQIMPHERSLKEGRLEEERRLMYVAMTRAKKYLTLSMARQRQRYGQDEAASPSRFLFEIPKELLRVVSWRQPM